MGARIAKQLMGSSAKTLNPFVGLTFSLVGIQICWGVSRCVRYLKFGKDRNYHAEQSIMNSIQFSK